MMLKNVLDGAVRAIAAKREKEFRRAIDAAFPAGWMIEEARRRCVIQRQMGSDGELFMIDGKAVLYIEPPTLQPDPGKDGELSLHLTFRFRRLYSDKQTPVAEFPDNGTAGEL